MRPNTTLNTYPANEKEGQIGDMLATESANPDDSNGVDLRPTAFRMCRVGQLGHVWGGRLTLGNQPLMSR